MFVPTWRLAWLTAAGALAVLPALWHGTLLPLALAYGLLLVVLCLTDAWLAVRPEQLHLSRRVPNSLSRGVMARAVLVARNEAPQPVRLSLRDELPAALGPAGDPPPLLLPPGGERESAVAVCPTRRGRQRLGGVTARWPSPLGLFERQARWDLSREVRVYPDLRAVQRGDLQQQAGRLLAAGVRAARLRGAGTEFESLREYQPDDPYRRIHWGATARRGRLVSRQYEVERSQTLVLCLDTGRLMTGRLGDRSRLDHALDTLLVLAGIALRLGDRVGLLVFAEEPLVYLPPGGGRAQMTRLLEALFDLDGRLVEPDYGAALRLLGLRQRKRALVVMFSDLVDTQASEVLLHYTTSLRPAHLPIFCSFGDPLTHALADGPPHSMGDVYRRALAAEALAERAHALARLRAAGVGVVDAPPERAHAELVRRYIEAKVKLTL